MLLYFRICLHFTICRYHHGRGSGSPQSFQFFRAQILLLSMYIEALESIANSLSSGNFEVGADVARASIESHTALRAYPSCYEVISRDLYTHEFTLLNNPFEWILPFPKIDNVATCFWRIWRVWFAPTFPAFLRKDFLSRESRDTQLHWIHSFCWTRAMHRRSMDMRWWSLTLLIRSRTWATQCVDATTTVRKCALSHNSHARVRHACVVGQTVEQALTVRDHPDGQVLLLPFVRQNSSFHQYLTQHCSRVFGQVKSVSTGTDFGSESRQDGSFRSLTLPGHERDWNDFTYQRFVLSTDTDTFCFAGALQFVRRACDPTPRALIVSSATDLSRVTRLDVFLRLPSASCLSHFSSLEFRLSYTELSLVGSGSRHTCRFAASFHKTPSGPVAKPDHQVSHRLAQSELVFHSTRHLHRHRPSSHLWRHTCWGGARDVRFDLVAVFVAKSKSSTCTMIIPMRFPEESRRQKKDRVQFERCPWVSLESVTQFFPRVTGRIGKSQHTFNNLDQDTFHKVR